MIEAFSSQPFVLQLVELFAFVVLFVSLFGIVRARAAQRDSELAAHFARMKAALGVVD